MFLATDVERCLSTLLNELQASARISSSHPATVKRENTSGRYASISVNKILAQPTGHAAVLYVVLIARMLDEKWQ